MIIESIELEGVRHFRNSVRLDGLRSGLNVIVAPNGTGKSTLVDGLVAALVQSHKTTGQGLADYLRHVAYELTPTITVVAKRGNNRYRIKKAFLKNAFAKLEHEKNGVFSAIADGEDVETWLNEALALQRPGAGKAKLENHGVGALLWSRQSEPSLKDLPTTQAQQFRALIAPGSSTVSAGELAILDAIDRKFEYYWKPKGNAFSTGKDSANIPSLENALQNASRKHKDSQQALADLAELRKTFADASLSQTLRQARRAEQIEQQKKLKHSAEEVRALDYQIKLYEQTAEIASKELTRLSRERDAVNAARDRITILEPERQTAAEQLARTNDDISVLEQALDESRREYQSAQEELRSLWEADRVVTDARDLVRGANVLQDLGVRIEKLENLYADQEQARKNASSVVAPEDDVWTAIQIADRQLNRARLREESESLTVRFTAEQDVDMHVESGSPSGLICCVAGTEAVLKGLGTIVFSAPGVGSWRVSSPSGSAAKLRKDIDDSAASLAALLAPFGNAGIEELQERRASRQAFERKAIEIAAVIDATLGGEAFDDIVAHRENQRAKRDDLLRRYPEWESTDPDADALALQIAPRLTAAKEASTKAAKTVEEQEKKMKRLREGQERLSEDLRHRDSKIQEYRGIVTRAEQAKLFEQIAMAGRQDIQATANLEGARIKRSAIDGDPVGDYDRLNVSIETLSNDVEREGERIAGLRARLESSAGAYEDVASAAAELESATLRLRYETRAANAVRILRERVRKASRALADAVHGPLAASATVFGRRIMGRSDIEVGFQVDEKGLMRLSFSKSAWDGKAVSETMSGGEREQIEVAMRLAMGSLLAKDEPQVVILDDALTFCDPVRLYRILEVLAEVEDQNLQILLTGCDSDRYASMPKGAHRIDLDIALQRSAVA
jgi:DNA repair exonuclease SbcCD ATPase subunit